MAKRALIGTVYLLHLHGKIAGHAGHYIGFSTNLEQRIQDHENGRGARLMEVAKERGIGFRIARLWRGQTRSFERCLKNRKNAPQLCPVCAELEARAKQAQEKKAA
jgi:predicted GIY-YIG superfamily endonuclease